MAFLTTIIPVYNGEKYLYETLDSAAKQTVKPDRVIIQDNCSTDGTKKVYEAFKNPAFEWKQNPVHVDMVANFNNALKYAEETEYLHILCADDLILPAFFERSLPALESHSGQALVYSAFDVIDEQSNIVHDGDITCYTPITKSGEPRLISKKKFISTQADLRTVLLPATIIKTCKKPSPFSFDARYASAFDVVFLAQWANLCLRIVEVPQILCHYRRHKNSVTNANFKCPGKIIENEWNIIETISSLIPAPSLLRILKQERNKCYLAARSHVKINLLATQSNDLKKEIKETTFKYVGLRHWLAGGCVVMLRNLLRKI